MKTEDLIKMKLMQVEIVKNVLMTIDHFKLKNIFGNDFKTGLTVDYQILN